ncbi:MAG: argininosuccinate synthase domain-containing protein, partial [Candidatus Omnitrophota bacterium]
MKKVVLAYSGGLDTSCIVKWLADRGYDVICFVADLGQGLGKGEDLEKIEERALAAGASKVYIKDLQDEFIDDF